MTSRILLDSNFSRDLKSSHFEIYFLRLHIINVIGGALKPASAEGHPSLKGLNMKYIHPKRSLSSMNVSTK